MSEYIQYISFTTHQPRTIYDFDTGENAAMFWDRNGNLAQIISCVQNSARLHEWDEKNRLRFDKGDIKHNEQDHVHFKDGSALNKDGTWKHGNGKLTNEQKQYLKQNGWEIE